MNFALSTVWLLIAAVLNPLCCCLGAIHSSEVVDQGTMQCCPLNSEMGNEAAQSHAPKECPHQVEKNATKFIAYTDQAPTVAPVLGLLMGTCPASHDLVSALLNPGQNADRLHTEVPDLKNAPPGNHQWFCLYLI